MGQERLEAIAVPLAHGYTTREIATVRGVTIRVVREELQALRKELETLSSERR